MLGPQGPLLPFQGVEEYGLSRAVLALVLECVAQVRAALTAFGSGFGKKGTFAK